MKILFIGENYYPHLGGAEVLFKNIAERYVQRGHQVTVLTHRLKGTVQQEEIHGVMVHRVNSLCSRYLFTFSSIWKAIRLAQDHDLIQTTTFNGAPPAWLAAKISRKPVVITVHEIWTGKWQDITRFSWFKSQLHELLERVIYLLPYDKYICVSQATKKDLLAFGIKEQKVVQIYNGFNYDLWNPAAFSGGGKIRKELGIGNKFLFLSWGRPGPSKGFEYLLKAVPLLKSHHSNFVVVLLLGQTKNSMNIYQQKYGELQQLIIQHQLQDHVRIMTDFSWTELGNYIQAADAVIIPSVSEGFGYTTVEAMALGKPVLVSDAGSLPEIVGGQYQIFENRNAADLAEKAVKLMSGEVLYKKEKKFGWDDCIEGYLKTYSLLVRKKE